MLEVTVAIAVLAAVIAPLASSYWGISRGFRKVTQTSVALMLARSILDHIHHRLYNYSSSPVPTNTVPGPGPDYPTDYTAFFASLKQDTEKRVATATATDLSSYFLYFGSPDATNEWIGLRDPNGELFKQMDDFSCMVEVNPGGIDSDMDGTNEKDMVEVIVTIRWSEEGIPREQRLQTVYSKYQYSSGFK